MKAKKSLGQNFLKSQRAIKKMVEVSGAQKDDFILEIGPGTGILTESLLQTGANVIAVEKDDLLIPVLEEKFEKEISSGQLTLIHDDILNFDFENQNYKLVANIPYYITGQIIRKFLTAENQPKSMTLLVQKEVAERIVAKDGKAQPSHKATAGKESLLSLSVKAYGEPKYIEKVPRGAFAPSPNVDSAIIHISNISRKNFSKGGPSREKEFFDLIHAGFAHKRKQLLPNLLAEVRLLQSNKDTLSSAFIACGLDLKCRAEDLSIETWLKLCDELNKNY